MWAFTLKDYIRTVMYYKWFDPTAKPGGVTVINASKV